MARRGKYGIISVGLAMSTRKVLVVEDDSTLLDVLRYNLAREGYEVATATDGGQAIEVARREKPDLLVLDVMLPVLDGFEVCRILRRQMPMPILMLTARTEEIDRVVGLELGADDYVSKPFSMRELLARVKALLRRTEAALAIASGAEAGTAPLRSGGLELDVAAHRAALAGVALELSPREFDLLAFLLANRGRVFSRDSLLEKVWGYDYSGDTRTVDVHVSWLRRKIEQDPAHPCRILTVRGVGYKFEE